MPALSSRKIADRDGDEEGSESHYLIGLHLPIFLGRTVSPDNGWEFSLLSEYLSYSDSGQGVWRAKREASQFIFISDSVNVNL